MIIELLGVPGSGKSTFATKYVEKYDAVNPLLALLYNKSRIFQNINKLKLSFYFCFFNPKQFVCFFKKLNTIYFRSMTKRMKMYLYLFSILGVISISQKKYSNKEIVLDEGVNQVLWGIMYNSCNSNQKIMALQKDLLPYFGNQIYLLKIDRDTVKKRLLKRTERGSELQKDIHENIKVLEQAFEHIKIIQKGIIDCKKKNDLIEIDQF